MTCEDCGKEINGTNPGNAYQYTVRMRGTGVELESRTIYFCLPCTPDFQHPPVDFEVLSWPQPIEDLCGGR